MMQGGATASALVREGNSCLELIPLSPAGQFSPISHSLLLHEAAPTSLGGA